MAMYDSTVVHHDSFVTDNAGYLTQKKKKKTHHFANATYYIQVSGISNVSLVSDLFLLVMYTIPSCQGS